MLNASRACSGLAVLLALAAERVSVHRDDGDRGRRAAAGLHAEGAAPRDGRATLRSSRNKKAQPRPSLVQHMARKVLRQVLLKRVMPK